jgi:hypothetical protein
MRILKGIAAVVATAAFAVSGLHADDGSQLADLQARIATLEAKMMAPAGAGDAEALTSLRKKGQVKIGGSVALDVKIKRRDEANTSDDDINSTETKWDDADLSLHVDAGTDTYLSMNFVMNEDNGEDVIDEIMFVWENVRGSNWSLVLGKTEAPFGQTIDKLVTNSFVEGGHADIMHDTENTNHEGDQSGWVNGAGSHTAGYGTFAKNGDEIGGHQDPMIMGQWQGETDCKVGLYATYKYRELGTLEMAVFQDNADMHEDRSSDNFQSYAMRLTVKPLPGLKLIASMLHRYNDAADDEQVWTDENGSGVASVGLDTNADRLIDALVAENVTAGQITAAEAAAWTPKRDSSNIATSLAFDYVTKDEKWEFYGEWIYNTSVGNYADLQANVFSIGAVYALTPKFDLIAEADAALLDNEVFEKLGVKFNENVYRAAFGVKYTMDNGMFFITEYSHEWYDSDLDQWDDGNGDQISFRTGWKF